jgi:hypothetical protein
MFNSEFAMSGEVIIRQAREDEVPAVLELWQEIGVTPPSPSDSLEVRLTPHLDAVSGKEQEIESRLPNGLTSKTAQAVKTATMRISHRA